MCGSMKLVAGLFSIVKYIGIIYVAIDERGWRKEILRAFFIP